MQEIKIKGGLYILCKEMHLQFSRSSVNSLAGHYDAIVLKFPRCQAVSHNTSKSTHIDEEQSNVIDLICIEDDESENNVPRDVTYSPENQAASPSAHST